jgi:protease I
MKKILFIVVPNGFRDEEYAIPKDLFEKKGYQITTASDKTGKLTGKLGKITAEASLLLKDINPNNFDALVIAGGQNYFWNNKTLLNIIKTMHQQHQLIAAICISAVIPAQAGIMTDKNITFFATEASLAEAAKYQTNYTGKNIEKTKNIITARDAEASQDFAEAIISFLENSVD